MKWFARLDMDGDEFVIVMRALKEHRAHLKTAAARALSTVHPELAEKPRRDLRLCDKIMGDIQLNIENEDQA